MAQHRGRWIFNPLPRVLVFVGGPYAGGTDVILLNPELIHAML